MTDVRHDIHQEVRAAKVLRANLADLIGDDDEALRDTLEGETSLHELIEAAINDISKDLAFIAGLKEHIAQLTERKSRLEDRVTSFRQSILTAMEMAVIQKKETPLATLSRKALPPSAVITDEALIPAEFWKAQDPVLDKKAVTDALNDKRTVPGAELDTGSETIAIKWS